MTLHLALGAALAALIGASALAQTASPSNAAPSAPPAEVARVESCTAHKFETTVRFTGANGKPRHSRVKLCGTEGQTDAQWAVTLRDAIKKVQANAGMAPEAREQVVAAINAELIKIESPAAAAALASPSASVATPPATAFTLPRQATRSGASAVPAGRLPEYSALPPLPAPLPAASAIAAGVAGSAAAPSLPAPRLTIRCILPDAGGVADSCATMEKGMQLSIRADESLPAGLRLRFLRRGDDRGEITLAGMQAGQTLRVRPPARLCAGVIRSQAQIQVVKGGAGPGAAGQVVDTLGPYELRC